MCRAGVRNLAHGAADKAARAPDNANTSERRITSTWAPPLGKRECVGRDGRGERKVLTITLPTEAPSKALFGGGRPVIKEVRGREGHDGHRGKNNCMGDKGAPSQKPGFFATAAGSCTQRPVSEGGGQCYKGSDGAEKWRGWTKTGSTNSAALDACSDCA
ncbi:hypothetical protein ERJ75_001141900 [Trypanosoma vivax]|nr:hypothetical protein ERJ75_001141900 [Trypanosoma vivax]